MQSDPYKGERTITQIQVPSNEPFSDTEAATEIGIRFSHYVSQWEFLVNIFHISISNFTLRKVKKLTDLLDWIRWSGLLAQFRPADNPGVCPGCHQSFPDERSHGRKNHEQQCGPFERTHPVDQGRN